MKEGNGVTDALAEQETYRLTQYSHGAGCGCKISPAILDSILKNAGQAKGVFPALLVGNEDKDDAAVMELENGTAIISTTDFFMPIVDDAFTFGRIAATNAISDIYAMGGSPMMAIAILGWPVNNLPPELAGLVVSGAQHACLEAGIPLAGGHSIDAPEPIFGLAVTGQVKTKNIKKNGGALPGDILFLTKPLGIGILTTAQKKEKLLPEHESLATQVMIRLNSIGEQLGKSGAVHAMTDVTGFGLAGHLLEMCKASQVTALIRYADLPYIHEAIFDYISQGCIPGGTNRNYSSMHEHIHLEHPHYKDLVCDPQTSGGLLIAVDPTQEKQIAELLRNANLHAEPIGVISSLEGHFIHIS